MCLPIIPPFPASTYGIRLLILAFRHNLRRRVLRIHRSPFLELVEPEEHKWVWSGIGPNSVFPFFLVLVEFFRKTEKRNALFNGVAIHFHRAINQSNSCFL